jgi:hypothetical protein
MFCPVEDIAFYEAASEYDCGYEDRAAVLGSLQMGGGDQYEQFVGWLAKHGIEVFVPDQDDWFQQVPCAVPLTLSELQQLAKNLLFGPEDGSEGQLYLYPGGPPENN